MIRHTPLRFQRCHVQCHCLALVLPSSSHSHRHPLSSFLLCRSYSGRDVRTAPRDTTGAPAIRRRRRGRRVVGIPPSAAAPVLLLQLFQHGPDVPPRRARDVDGLGPAEGVVTDPVLHHLPGPELAEAEALPVPPDVRLVDKDGGRARGRRHRHRPMPTTGR